ncbi:gluconate 2-dehydrogenase subunit 3 family protein [Fulvivirgaceae bacterium BMA12]|uniref:Gluconate 2-dehydrogenase subunit 3 family protein n=1 Tax=Agaribacillus aureus TaxID=3051825 RepID=A0ABT8KZ87_9BACT|nr:gluconate 2-dehydrogenase subunit 3 family protein [Fulvivirgaceae bacterium BMA12]
MKRREAIRKTTWILKSAVFGPGLVSALYGCQQKVSDSDDLAVLNSQQHNLAKFIADTILPRTDTPSASDALVPQFLDLLLKDVFDEEVKEHFIAGLNQFEVDCKSSTGKSFTQLDQQARNEYLDLIDREVMAKAYDKHIPFYFTFKQLTITIYFSSERGVKQNLNYMPIPGAFQGDISLDPSDKIMLGNQMSSHEPKQHL